MAIKLTIETKQAKSIKDFIWELDRIRPHQVYFQQLANKNFITRTITNLTNTKWIETEIKFGRIYLPLDITFAETS